MPLLRGLTMRLYDNFVGNITVSNVENFYRDQFDMDGIAFPSAAVYVPTHVSYVYRYEDQDCITGLAKSTPNTIGGKTGHIHDFAKFANTTALYFCSAKSSSGYFFDEDNDSLLLPEPGTGDFTISFWVNPWRVPSGVYDVAAKPLAGSSLNRFRIFIDTSGLSPSISFTAANSDGTSESTATARLILSRWTLVIARCRGSEISIKTLSADGIFGRGSVSSGGPFGCSHSGGDFYLGVGRDGSSNRLDAGEVYLQQACFWRKSLSDSEETELYYNGRGKTHWSDFAVPETFSGSGKYGQGGSAGSVVCAVNDEGVVTSFNNESVSPYVPCQTCDSEPCCFPVSMTDPSPDEIVVSVSSWLAAATGCVPEGTSFTMTRNENQIIQGFIFGRTFESEKIDLECGGYIKFFLESTPYHWSKYRHRCYLGIETNWGGTKKIAKYRATLGSALVKKPVTGGSNKFTSPDLSGVSYDFPYATAFSGYASQIQAAGWTPFAVSVLEEAFPVAICLSNTPSAACIAASGYIFGTGEEKPETRGGSCGWQMGIASVTGSGPITSADSKYNYRVSCNSPGVSNNTIVTPSFSELHRPFTAAVQGIIGCQTEDGTITNDDMPFTDFAAVLYPSEFVRPEPFLAVNTTTIRNAGPGGCIDCQVSSGFLAANETSANAVISTAPITTRKCPQKTLSGAIPAVLSGASDEDSVGMGVARVLGEPTGPTFTTISNNAEYQQQSGKILLDRGTLRANGAAEFSAQIDDYNQGEIGSAYLHISTKTNTKIDPNESGVDVPRISKGTKFGPWIETLSGSGRPLDASDLKNVKPDRGTLSSPNPIDYIPVVGSESLTKSSCSCGGLHRQCSFSEIDWQISGILHLFDAVSVATCVTESNANCGDLTSPGVSFSEFSSTGQSGGCEVSTELAPRSSVLISEGAMLTGSYAIYTQRYFSAPICLAISDSLPGGASDILYAGVSSATTSAFCENGLLTVDLTYTCSYTRRVGIPVTTRTTNYWENRVATGNDLWQERSDVYQFVFAKTETRVARFQSSFSEDLCLRSSLGDIELSFVSDVAVSQESSGGCYGDIPSANYAVCLAIANHLAGPPFCAVILETPYSTASPVLSTPSGTGCFPFGGYGTYENGRLHLSSGQATIMYPGWCAEDVTTLFPDDQYGNPPIGVDPVVWNSRYYIKSACETFSEFDPFPLVDACNYSLPRVVDFSQSTINAAAASPQSAPVSDEGFADDGYEFSIATPEDYAGTYEISQTERHGVMSSYSGTNISSAVSFSAGILEIYGNSEECREVVARYALSRHPNGRWNRNGKNHMRIVSADWSLGNWPKYITVEPA